MLMQRPTVRRRLRDLSDRVGYLIVHTHATIYAAAIGVIGIDAFAVLIGYSIMSPGSVSVAIGAIALYAGVRRWRRRRHRSSADRTAPRD
ncbi:hypothetical protein BH11ACT3_BH11ACT3_04620 [soil metagenome]